MPESTKTILKLINIQIVSKMRESGKTVKN